jgi:hypothetical protein
MTTQIKAFISAFGRDKPEAGINTGDTIPYRRTAMSKGYRDEKAPSSLQVIIRGADGKEWGTVYATAKEFSTGSVGFYASGKIANPENPEARYQAGINFTLIGSKPA